MKTSFRAAAAGLVLLLSSAVHQASAAMTTAVGGPAAQGTLRLNVFEISNTLPSGDIIVGDNKLQLTAHPVEIMAAPAALVSPNASTGPMAPAAQPAATDAATASSADIAAAPVPLPAGLWLLGTGLLALLGWIGRLQVAQGNRDDASLPGREFDLRVRAAKKIAIVSINYRPELTGIAVYSTGMAEYLAAAGHEVDVFCGFPYYPRWKKEDADRGVLSRQEQFDGVRVRRHWLYVPARPSALKRILHELSFVCSVTLGYMMAPRSGCTIIVSPPLLIGIPIAILAWLKGSRTVFHVQDLQPDAAVELGMLPPGPITGILYAIERATYEICDKVGTVSEAMRRRIEAKGVARRKLFLFRNWANEEVRPRCGDTQYRRDWQLEGKFVVLYAGNMGVKQGLGMLLDCAELTMDKPEIVYLIVGDGGEKQNLLAQAEQRRLTNVMFRSLQPLDRLAELLATGDVSVIPQKSGARDIALPSKLGNIMGSARPVIVAADPDSELANIIKEADCGSVCRQGDAHAMTEAILALAGDSASCRILGENGHRYGAAKLERNAILYGLMQQLDSLIPVKTPLSQDQVA